MAGYIAGIDAGATSAYAIIALDGEVVEVKSKKDAGRAFLFESLGKFSPLFVACDTNPPSRSARRLKRAFACKLFFPNRSMPVLEKETMCKGIAVRNAHERDALASAMKCHNFLSSKLRQLKRRLSERGAQDSFEVVARGMLSGKRVSRRGRFPSTRASPADCHCAGELSARS